MKSSVLFTLIIAAIFAISLTGCSGSKNTGTIKATYWELKTLTELSSLNFKAKPTVEFTSDGRMLGFGGCNNFGGQYKVSGSSLTTSDMYSTEKYCDQMQVENIFIQALQKTSTYEIEDSKLYLYSNGKLTAVLSKTEK